MHGNFEMFSRVWRSIEPICTEKLCERSAFEDFLSIKLVRISSSGAYLGKVELEKDHYAVILYGRGEDDHQAALRERRNTDFP